MLRICTHRPSVVRHSDVAYNHPQQIRAQATNGTTSAAKLQFWNITPAPGSCPFAQRGWIALEEKQVPYDKHLVDKANKTQEFLDLYQSIWPDPEASAKVPTIIDTNGFKLTESSVVVEYLDAQYPEQGPRLVPQDPTQAAKARLFAEVFSSAFTKKVSALYGASSPAELVDAKRGLVGGMQVLEQFLQTHGQSQGPFLLGSDYTVAEVYTAPFLKSASIVLPHYRNVDLVQQAQELGLDRLAAWIQGVLERPSTTATSVPDDVRLEYSKARVAEVKG